MHSLLCGNKLVKASGIIVGMCYEFRGYVDVPLIGCPIAAWASSLAVELILDSNYITIQ